MRQLRLLFLQLYKSEAASVRPEEELAYLAITRPEIDQIVSPEVTEKPALLDTIPTIPSPSSTRVATPEFSPTPDTISLPDSPTRPELDRSESILGKRASTDRDDSSRSSTEHTRRKSEGMEIEDESGSGRIIAERTETATQTDKDSDEFEIVLGENKNMEEIERGLTRVDSPSGMTDIGTLKLKSPELEELPMDLHERVGQVPPPLPPRPAVTRKDTTLASGLRFGE